MRPEWGAELDALLEDLSYELTAARTAGLDRPDLLRASLRRARQLVDDADALAGAAQAEDQTATPGADF